MSDRCAESVIEQATLDWLQGPGCSYAFGPDMACDGLLAKLMSGEVRVKE